jgi:hypothetical protein
VANRRARFVPAPGPSRLYRPTPLHWALYGALYLATLVACFQGFWLWRSTLDRVLGVLFWRHDWFETVYLTCMCAVGLVLFCLVVGAEPYLRGVLVTSYYPQGSYLVRLVLRFLVVAVLVAIVVGPAAGIQEWAIRNLHSGMRLRS